MQDQPSNPGFWEIAFTEKKEMWGFEPADSALIARDFFLEKGLKNILIPGIGYGRNARAFTTQGMMVTGIEISASAIEMAKKHYGTDMTIHHGSVTDMPFDDVKYDGIFCYALIHLLNSRERKKLISDCYDQLADNCYMIFTAISKKAHTYGQGAMVGKDRYEMFGGVNMFFYDETSIREEFGAFGLIEINEVTENYPFHFIKCKKGKDIPNV